LFMLKFAIGNLLSRRARSLLSLLGLTVAIIGMVGLFSVAGGIDSMVADTFGRIPGLIAMQRGAPIPLFSRIPRAWQTEIEQVPGVRVVSAEIWVRVNLINEKSIVSPPRFFFGADVDAHARLKDGVYQSAMLEGRYLNESDVDQPHGVISKQIASSSDWNLPLWFLVVGRGDHCRPELCSEDFEIRSRHRLLVLHRTVGRRIERCDCRAIGGRVQRSQDRIVATVCFAGSSES
jgi:hypothetical protein